MTSPSGRWVRRGVAVAPTEPWERGGMKNFCGEAEPVGGGAWRVWYYAHAHDRKGSVLAVAEGKPGGTQRKFPLRAAPGDARRSGAEWTLSNLPEGWQPVQPVYLRLSEADHRLYFWAHAPGVVRYLLARSQDGRHFVVDDPHRAVLYHFHDRAVAGSDIPPGLTTWGGVDKRRPAHEAPADPGIVCNDATHVYPLPDGSFELYTVALVSVAADDPRYMAHDNAAGVVRVIDRMASRDGVRFGERRRVLEPSPSDPPGLQFYYLSVTHLPWGRLGLLGHYRADLQTMAIEKAFSADGVAWERPNRAPWLDHGQAGEPDSWMALAPHRLVRDGGTWRCFYTGFNHAHNFKEGDEPRRAGILHAEWEGDDLALPPSGMRKTPQV